MKQRKPLEERRPRKRSPAEQAELKKRLGEPARRRANLAQSLEKKAWRAKG